MSFEDLEMQSSAFAKKGEEEKKKKIYRDPNTGEVITEDEDKERRSGGDYNPWKK